MKKTNKFNLLLIGAVLAALVVLPAGPALAQADGCGDAGGGSMDIDTLTASFDADSGGITVAMTLCSDPDEQTQYRVHFDHTAPFAPDMDRNGDTFIDDDDFCVTTSDDGMKHKGNKDTGPGQIVVSNQVLTYTVNMAELNPALMIGDTILVWADTQFKGIVDRAPDTDASDGCGKPEVVDEFIALVLAPPTGPKLQVAPDSNSVWSSGPWTPGATIELTIEEDGSGVVYSDSQGADAGGNFNFDLWGVFDLQRGHVVTVSDGADTKTHTVIDLFLDSVNVVADTVSGRAGAGTSVVVWVGDNGSLTVTAEGSGDWTADFSGMTDLTYLSNIGSQQNDTDGDSTCVFWNSPKFQVAPDSNSVWSSGPWTPGATIELTIEEDGSGVVYSDSQGADAGGNFNFDLWGVFDLQRGHVVTVSDGADTKTHTVTDLFLDSVNVAADTVSGRAGAGTSVVVWVGDNGSLTVTAEGSGDWTADFSGMTDLTYLSNIGSQQNDTDGDSTCVFWNSPKFQVAPDSNSVWSSGPWTPGATIELTIEEDGSGVVYSDSQGADAGGNFNFDLWGVFDLQRGHEVTVSDGADTKTHTVTDLFLDSVNVAADTVSGRAGAGTSVVVWVGDNGSLTVTAEGSGDWTADFSGMTDLTYLSNIGSQQNDTDGDSTCVFWDSP